MEKGWEGDSPHHIWIQLLMLSTFCSPDTFVTKYFIIKSDMILLLTKTQTSGLNMQGLQENPVLWVNETQRGFLHVEGDGALEQTA